MGLNPSAGSNRTSGAMPDRISLPVSGGALTALYDPELARVMVTYQPHVGSSVSFWVAPADLDRWADAIAAET